MSPLFPRPPFGRADGFRVCGPPRSDTSPSGCDPWPPGLCQAPPAAGSWCEQTQPQWLDRWVPSCTHKLSDWPAAPRNPGPYLQHPGMVTCWFLRKKYNRFLQFQRRIIFVSSEATADLFSWCWLKFMPCFSMILFVFHLFLVFAVKTTQLISKPLLLFCYCF